MRTLISAQEIDKVLMECVDSNVFGVSYKPSPKLESTLSSLLLGVTTCQKEPVYADTNVDDEYGGQAAAYDHINQLVDLALANCVLEILNRSRDSGVIEGLECREVGIAVLIHNTGDRPPPYYKEN